MHILSVVHFNGCKVSFLTEDDLVSHEEKTKILREYKEKYGPAIDETQLSAYYSLGSGKKGDKEFLRRLNLPVKEIHNFKKEPDFKEREDYIVIVGSKIIVKRLSDGEFRGCWFQYMHDGEERLERWLAARYQMDVDKVIITGTPPEMELRSCKDEVVSTFKFDESERDKSVDGIESLRNELCFDSGEPEIYTNKEFVVPDWLVIYGRDNIIKLKFTPRMKELFTGKFRIYGPDDDSGYNCFAQEYAELLGVKIESNLYEFLYGEEVEEIRVGW